MASRGAARTSVSRPAGGFSGGGASRDFGQAGNRDFNQNANRDFNQNVNQNVDRNINQNVNRNFDQNINRNFNQNINRDIDVDRDWDVDVDHRYGGWGYGCCYHPGTAAAVATAAAVTTAAVVGSVVTALPSNSCEAINVGGVTYQHCGSTWYQPQFMGSTVNYIVVNPPS